MHFYYLCLCSLSLFLLFTSSLVNSRFGLMVRGAGNNERRIKSLGIHANHYKLVLFTIAGGGAGLAGALLANQTEYISPGLMHWTLSGELMVMVLLGGLGTLFGPVLGAAMFLLLEEGAGHVYRTLDDLYGTHPDFGGYLCQARPVRAS